MSQYSARALKPFLRCNAVSLDVLQTRAVVPNIAEVCLFDKAETALLERTPVRGTNRSLVLI